MQQSCGSQIIEDMVQPNGCSKQAKKRCKKPIKFDLCLEHWAMVHVCNCCDRSMVNLTKHREYHGVFEFAAMMFDKLCGRAGGQVFRRALIEADAYKDEIQLAIEDTLQTMLGPHYDADVVALVLYGEGKWGDQRSLTEFLVVEENRPIDKSKLTRLIQRTVFCLVVAMFGGLLDHVCGQTREKLAWFEPIIKYLVSNRRYTG